MPNATHWQHPGFFAYFVSTASGPGMLAEMLAAALNQNPMLWRTSPSGTELEQVVVDWLRQALGLPTGFDGLLTDTASTSSLIALAAAREAAGIDAAAAGIAGRPDVAALRVYASREAHSSIEKACMTLGLGRASLVRVATNERFELEPAALDAAIDADRGAGLHPVAIVATVGTTSSTAVDPVAAIADIAEREGLWLHVDAAYAGAVAIDPGLRGAVRRLGACRLDRRQPPQVALHPGRRLAPADAADGDAPRRVQPRPRVPADGRWGGGGARLQRVHAPARTAIPGVEAVGPAPLVRPRRPPPPDPPPSRAGPGVCRLGR